jgi:hypothetical protein
VAVPSPAPVATDPPCADEEDAEPVVISRRSVRRRPPASSNPLPAVLSLLCVATAGIAAYVLWPTDAPWRRRQESSVRRQEQAASKPQPRPESAAAIDRDRPRPGERIPRERLRPSPVPAQPRRGRPVMESGEPDVATPPPQPQPPEPPMEPEPPAADTGRIEKQANRLLGDALSALQNGKFDKADQLVEAMLKLDADAPALGLADRATGWKQLCRNARQFRGFRDRALADVTGDVAIGNSRIVVVESNPKLFVYKEKGVNKRVSPEAIPDHILTAVVAHWFAGAAQPGNHVFLGVQHLIKRKPDPAAARAEWNRASSGGVNTSNLEPLLQDPVITAAAR